MMLARTQTSVEPSLKPFQLDKEILIVADDPSFLYLLKMGVVVLVYILESNLHQRVQGKMAGNYIKKLYSAELLFTSLNHPYDLNT